MNIRRNQLSVNAQSFVHSVVYSFAGRRMGLTIMEVLISIGVILVGLLGVSALIPVAAENARSAIRTDVAVRYGVSITSELRARGIGDLTNYIRRDNDPRNDDFLGANTNTVARPIALGVPNDSPSMRLATNGNGIPRSGVLASFCIDPLLLSQFQTPAETTLSPNNRNAYDRSRFPYYNEYYNGLPRPNEQLANLGSGFPLPRMWRIAPPSLTSSVRFLSPTVAWNFASSESELSFQSPDDRLDPVGQIVNVYQYNVAGSEASGIGAVASRQTEDLFTWFATLVPPPDGSNTYKLSTVVVERRGIGEAPLQTDMNPYLARTTRDNYKAERVVWIESAISLGSTTEVEVYGNELVSDKIVANQWVMLSAQPAITVSGNVIPSPTLPAVHRWFRVLQVGESVPGTYTSPAGSFDGWRRRVVLDGPNWSFANGGSMIDDTYMTIIDGAVAVIENDIRL